jgi:hypothetical protein
MAHPAAPASSVRRDKQAPSVRLVAAGAIAADPPQKKAGATTSSTPSAPKTLHAKGEVRETGGSTKNDTDTAEVSSNLQGSKGPKGEKPKAAKDAADPGASAASTSPKTGKKDGNPKKDRTDNK